MTKTTPRSVPHLPRLARMARLSRLLAVVIAALAPTLANAAASSALALGDPETYALVAAGLGMMVFMAGRRSSR